MLALTAFRDSIKGYATYVPATDLGKFWHFGPEGFLPLAWMGFAKHTVPSWVSATSSPEIVRVFIMSKWGKESNQRAKRNCVQ